ncbi:hypothetical protein BJ508DRAFT_348790, partial [Ascobolus immersus RN42]
QKTRHLRDFLPPLQLLKHHRHTSLHYSSHHDLSTRQNTMPPRKRNNPPASSTALHPPKTARPSKSARPNNRATPEERTHGARTRQYNEDRRVAEQQEMQANAITCLERLLKRRDKVEVMLDDYGTCETASDLQSTRKPCGRPIDSGTKEIIPYGWHLLSPHVTTSSCVVMPLTQLSSVMLLARCGWGISSLEYALLTLSIPARTLIFALVLLLLLFMKK